MPVKHPEAAMSPEQRRREVAALLGLAVRRLVMRPGACVACLPGPAHSSVCGDMPAREGSPARDDPVERGFSPAHGRELQHECAPGHGATGHHRLLRPHRFPSRSRLDGAEDAGRDRPLPVGLALGDDGGGP